MSEDARNSEHLHEEETSAKGTETGVFSESVEQTISNDDQEELAAGGKQDEIVGVVGIRREEFPVAHSSRQEEFAGGAIGGSQEASAEGGAIPKSKIVLGIQDVQKAFLSNSKKQLGEFQEIKNDILRTIRELKRTARTNPGNWEFFERFREHINESYAFLNEIKEAMSLQESREEYLTLQMNQFFESKKQEGENVGETSLRLGTIEDVDVTIQTDCGASDEVKSDDANENVDKGKIAMAVVDHVMKAAKLRQNTGEADEEARLGAAAGGIDVRAPHELHQLNVAAEANVAEDEGDDREFLYPVVTGKYTLAIRAHHLFPESSSDESPPPEEIPQYPQGAERNDVRRDNVAIEEGMADDQGSSSDSPVEETSHQL